VARSARSTDRKALASASSSASGKDLVVGCQFAVVEFH
jgi:hypothetical protein